MPRCSFRQDRRVLVPCFSISHSPGPHSFRPVLSTSRCTGSLPGPRPRHLQRLGPAAEGACGPARRDRARAGGGWSRSALRSGAAPGGTRPAASAPSGSPGPSRGLPARRGAGLGAPGRDRLLGEPDRQAAALAQGGVILGPVGDPVPLLGDAVTASGVGLERHGGFRGSWKGPLPYATSDRSVQQGAAKRQFLHSGPWQILALVSGARTSRVSRQLTAGVSHPGPITASLGAALRHHRGASLGAHRVQADYNQTWITERHGYRTPAEVRADQVG